MSRAVMASTANHISTDTLAPSRANDRALAIAQNDLSLEGIDLIISSIVLPISVLVLSLLVG